MPASRFPGESKMRRECRYNELTFTFQKNRPEKWGIPECFYWESRLLNHWNIWNGWNFWNQS